MLQYTTTTSHFEGIVASASYLETLQEILVSCKRKFVYVHAHARACTHTHTHTVLSYNSWNYIIHTFFISRGEVKKINMQRFHALHS